MFEAFHRSSSISFSLLLTLITICCFRAAVISSPMESFSSFDEAFDAVNRKSDYCRIGVTVTMNKVYEYENQMDAEAEIESKVTKGLMIKEQNKKTDKSTNAFEESAKAGVEFKIIKLEFGAKYSRGREISYEVMSETELRSGEEITVKRKIAAGKTLTRWKVFAIVTNEITVLGKSIDTDKDLTEKMKESEGNGEAKIYLPRKIVYGETQFRIRHKGTNKYLISVLIDNKGGRSDLLTLRRNPNYYFKLDKCPNGVRIRAVNCTYSNKCYAHSNDPGQIILTCKVDNDLSQIWIISKTDNLRNGDVVTFRNKKWENADLCHSEKGGTTNVFCLYNTEDEWVLEM